MLSVYGIFSEHSDASLSIELSAETTTYLSSDTQTGEDNQMFHEANILPVTRSKYQVSHFQVICILPHPTFTVWQPPKTC